MRKPAVHLLVRLIAVLATAVGIGGATTAAARADSGAIYPNCPAGA
jgi:hypothetical protein